MPTADVLGQLDTLCGEFKRYAELHPWLCLAVPTDPSAPPWLGELVQWYAPQFKDFVRPSGLLDADGQALTATESVGMFRSQTKLWHDKFDECGAPPWVEAPKDARLQAVIEYVYALNDRAAKLLESVIDAVRCPTDVAQDIRNSLRGGYTSRGWVRWLAVSVRPQFLGGGQTPGRYHNYAQVAATALAFLRDQCTAVVTKRQTGGRPPDKTAQRINQRCWELYYRDSLKMARVLCKLTSEFPKETFTRDSVRSRGKRYATNNNLSVKRKSQQKHS